MNDLLQQTRTQAMISTYSDYSFFFLPFWFTRKTLLDNGIENISFYSMEHCLGFGEAAYSTRPLFELQRWISGSQY
jgi:hypothetical protein